MPSHSTSEIEGIRHSVATISGLDTSRAGDTISVRSLLSLTNSRRRPPDTAAAAADVVDARCLNELMRPEGWTVGQEFD